MSAVTIWALPFDLGKARSPCSFAKGPSVSSEGLSGRAPVAQLDRAPDYESGGQRFESFRARHYFQALTADSAPRAKAWFKA